AAGTTHQAGDDGLRWDKAVHRLALRQRVPIAYGRLLFADGGENVASRLHLGKLLVAELAPFGQALLLEGAPAAKLLAPVHAAAPPFHPAVRSVGERRPGGRAPVARGIQGQSRPEGRHPLASGG